MRVVLVLFSSHYQEGIFELLNSKNFLQHFVLGKEGPVCTTHIKTTTSRYVNIKVIFRYILLLSRNKRYLLMHFGKIMTKFTSGTKILDGRVCTWFICLSRGTSVGCWAQLKNFRVPYNTKKWPAWCVSMNCKEWLYSTEWESSCEASFFSTRTPFYAMFHPMDPKWNILKSFCCLNPSLRCLCQWLMHISDATSLCRFIGCPHCAP
jgi:hypothetical protein